MQNEGIKRQEAASCLALGQEVVHCEFRDLQGGQNRTPTYTLFISWRKKTHMKQMSNYKDVIFKWKGVDKAANTHHG